MLAGTWILVLVPLMGVFHASEWASNVPVPTVFDFRGVVALDETFLGNLNLFESLVFCIGVVLLFSKERGRRRSKLDWTRRWGVICSYVVLLLSAVQILFITALVLAGIAAVFLSMPLQYQPEVTQLFVDVSTAYLRYGAYPEEISVVVLVVFSSIAILLACVPLFDALRCSGPRWVAALLLAPLALFAVMHLAQVGRYCLGFTSVTPADISNLIVYFRPWMLINYIADRLAFWNVSISLGEFSVEAAKWCGVLTIAVWLSIAQLAAWGQGKKANAV